jgi:hypothetical protein
MKIKKDSVDFKGIKTQNKVSNTIHMSAHGGLSNLIYFN